MIENNYLIEQTDLYFLEKKTKKSYIENFNEQALLADEKYSQTKYALKACTFDLQRAIYNKNDKQAEILRTKCEKLKKELDDITAGLKPALKKYTPDCKICRDSGEADGERCLCFYRKLNELAYGFLGLQQPKLASFETDSGKTQNTDILEKLRRYAQKFYFNSPANLVFTGKRGTGKTFAAQAVADALCANKYNALFINAFQLNDIYFRIIRAPFGDKQCYEDILTKSDLLVIDDLGSERIINGISAENLLMIITQRLANEKPFIITTNLTHNEIGVKYGERVMSRMYGNNTAQVIFKGDDQRFNS